jgi:hypothetical protein
MFEELNKTFQDINSDYKSTAGFGTIEGLAYGIGNLIVGAAVSITLICLAYGFIKFTMAQGDPKAMQQARSAVFWSLIAMFAALLAFGIKSAIFKTMGMQ